MEREFPSNSSARARKTVAPSPREESKEKVERVVQGRVVRRKKPIGRKFVDMFGGDARGAGSYVIFDILIPAAKDAIVDGFTMGIERMVFGDASPRRRGGGNNVFRQGNIANRTNYQQPQMSSIRQESLTRRGRANFEFDEILLATRVEADEVLAKMLERIELYDVCTVADLYDALGEDQKWTDQKYGWIDLGLAQVRRARGGGYLLDLPKPEPLE